MLSLVSSMFVHMYICTCVHIHLFLSRISMLWCISRSNSSHTSFAIANVPTMQVCSGIPGTFTTACRPIIESPKIMQCRIICYMSYQYHWLIIVTAFLEIPPPQFKLVLDSVIWAFKHTMRNISEIGLDILHTMLKNIAQHDQAAQNFYSLYYTDIVQHVFSVVADSVHTGGIV